MWHLNLTKSCSAPFEYSSPCFVMFPVRRITRIHVPTLEQSFGLGEEGNYLMRRLAAFLMSRDGKKTIEYRGSTIKQRHDRRGDVLMPRTWVSVLSVDSARYRSNPSGYQVENGKQTFSG